MIKIARRRDLDLVVVCCRNGVDADIDLVHFIIGLLTHPQHRQLFAFLEQVTEFMGPVTAEVSFSPSLQLLHRKVSRQLAPQDIFVAMPRMQNKLLL